MSVMRKCVCSWLFVYIPVLTFLALSGTADANKMQRFNSAPSRVIIDGQPMRVIGSSQGDLNGDGRKEIVLAVRELDSCQECQLVVARNIHGDFTVITFEDSGWDLRASITDINGDHQLEIVTRFSTGDGHWKRTVYALRKGRLITIHQFDDARFIDLDGDGIPEVRNLSLVSGAAMGDHWLTVWKWNGQKYIDVSRRFPKLYDKVINDLRHLIHQSRRKFSPETDPYTYTSLYYYLGMAYEYRGQITKAKAEYATAYWLLSQQESGYSSGWREYYPEMAKYYPLNKASISN